MAWCKAAKVFVYSSSLHQSPCSSALSACWLRLQIQRLQGTCVACCKAAEQEALYIAAACITALQLSPKRVLARSADPGAAAYLCGLLQGFRAKGCVCSSSLHHSPCCSSALSACWLELQIQRVQHTCVASCKAAEQKALYIAPACITAPGAQP